MVEPAKPKSHGGTELKISEPKKKENDGKSLNMDLETNISFFQRTILPGCHVCQLLRASGAGKIYLISIDFLNFAMFQCIPLPCGFTQD